MNYTLSKKGCPHCGGKKWRLFNVLGEKCTEETQTDWQMAYLADDVLVDCDSHDIRYMVCDILGDYCLDICLKCGGGQVYPPTNYKRAVKAVQKYLEEEK